MAYRSDRISALNDLAAEHAKLVRTPGVTSASRMASGWKFNRERIRFKRQPPCDQAPSTLEIYSLDVIELNLDGSEFIPPGDRAIPGMYRVRQLSPVQQHYNSVGAGVLCVDRIELDAAYEVETDSLPVFQG